MAERFLYAQDVANLLGVEKRKAAELMQGMRCMNMSRNPASKRPRWATTASEVARWQKVRMEIPDERAPVFQEKNRSRRNGNIADMTGLLTPDGKIARRKTRKEG